MRPRGTRSTRPQSLPPLDHTPRPESRTGTGIHKDKGMRKIKKCRDCGNDTDRPVRCSTCNEVKQDFWRKSSTRRWKDRATKAGTHCSRCHKRVQKSGVCEGCRAYVSAWKRACRYKEPNPQRGKKPSLFTSKLLAAQDGKCLICGTKDGPWHVDHIVPKILGGPEREDNFQVLCAPCNLRKGRNYPYTKTLVTLDGRELDAVFDRLESRFVKNLKIL